MKIFKASSKAGFSLIELMVVVSIIAVLSGGAYIGVQKARVRSMNNKVVADLVAISNALESYKRDHFNSFPIPDLDGSMNVSCYDMEGVYAHDCDKAAFRQGMIDNKLLTKAYLREVPTDPRTNSRYVYGVSSDGKYYQVAGLYERSDGTWESRTAENIGKGFFLPSLIRAYNGPNFVMNKDHFLPYSPNHLILTGTLENIDGMVGVFNGSSPVSSIYNGYIVKAGDTIDASSGSVDIYFSDGSVTTLENGKLFIDERTMVAENSDKGIITKIRLTLESGKIWNKVARLASSSEFNVEASGAIAGVRGTEFGIVDNLTKLIVASGSVAVVALGEESEIHSPSLEPGKIAQADEETVKQFNADTNSVGTGNPVSGEIEEFVNRVRNTVHLHNNIRPKIINIDKGEMTVENPFFSLGIVSDDKRIMGTGIEVLWDGGSKTVDPSGSWGETPWGGSDENRNNHFTISTSQLGGTEFNDLRIRFVYEKGGEAVYSGYSYPLYFSDISSQNRKMLHPGDFNDPELLIKAPSHVIKGETFELPLLWNNGIVLLEGNIKKWGKGEDLLFLNLSTDEYGRNKDKYEFTAHPENDNKWSLRNRHLIVDPSASTPTENNPVCTVKGISSNGTLKVKADGIGICVIKARVKNGATSYFPLVSSVNIQVVEALPEDAALICSSGGGFFDGTDCFNIDPQSIVMGETETIKLSRNGSSLSCSSWTAQSGSFTGSDFTAPFTKGSVTLTCNDNSAVFKMNVIPGNYTFVADYSDGKIESDYAKNGEQSTSGDYEVIDGLKVTAGEGNYVSYETKDNISNDGGVIEIEVNKDELLSAGYSYLLDVVDDNGKHIEVNKAANGKIWFYAGATAGKYFEDISTIDLDTFDDTVKIIINWSTLELKIADNSGNEIIASKGGGSVPTFSFSASTFYVGSKESGAVSNTVGTVGDPLQYIGHIKSVKIKAE